MKNNNKRWPLPVYLAEILLLIAVIVLVVKFVPDFGRHPADVGVSGESKQSSENESGDAPRQTDETGEDGIPDESDRAGQSGQSQEGDIETGEAAGEHSASENKKKPGSSGLDRGNTGTAKVPEETQAPYAPPTMFAASDLHYMSPTMTDYGKVLDELTEGSDGKVVPYLDQITDAFLEEVMVKKPSVLILSGDISQDGEKVNHGELARKLRRVQAAGVQVLVIPGNHDINNPMASTYYGDKMVPTEAVDADGFYDIYHEFGYDQAADRDESSLSYLYRVDERYWLMMLDTCKYYPENEVGGRIRSGTLDWMEEWLEKAEAEQVTVIPVGHHNLLKESVLYTDECTLENQRAVIDLLEKYKLPIYISGHLHLQRVKKNINSPSSVEAYGIHEIVSSSLSIPPCQYGILNWSEDGSLKYRTQTVDVAAWAKRRGSVDENLLNFGEYSSKFLVDVISSQLYRSVYSIPKDRKTDMAALYGMMNSAYCGGRRINAADIKSGETYFYWKRYLGESKWFDRLTAILRDTGHDHNILELRAGEGAPASDNRQK